MVEDYLSDREQEEALRAWWRENRNWILGGVVLGLGVLGGWQYWQKHRNERADAAAKVYAEFQGALTRRDNDQAERLMRDLADEHGSSAYVQQARLMLAKTRADEGKFEAALPHLQAIITESRDEELAQVARLRSARLLAQLARHDDALKMLDVETTGAFAAQVREVRGDVFAAKGDNKSARAEYAAALGTTDPGINRPLVELKLQEVGGADEPTPAAEGQP
jgi:predicted negative regulator of RcsB-dependent stress response